MVQPLQKGEGGQYYGLVALSAWREQSNFVRMGHDPDAKRNGYTATS